VTTAHTGQKITYLIQLAWDLHELGVDSVVRFPAGQQPSMEIVVPGRKPTTAQGVRVLVGAWDRGCERGARTRARMVCERIVRRSR